MSEAKAIEPETAATAKPAIAESCIISVRVCSVKVEKFARTVVCGT